MLERKRKIIFVLFVLQLSNSETFREIYPEQIHLSLGESSQEMVVTWVTFSTTKNSFVWYGVIDQGLTYRADGFSKKFIDGGKSKTVRYIHKVVLRDLRPQTFYVYRCGSFFGLSDPFVFKMISKETNWSPKLIIFGDMGWENATAFPYILHEASGYNVDAVVHVGDIAYNMDSCDGFVGDAFLQMIQPLASCIPYMTTVGNHEQAYNFSHYKNKFSMPGSSEGLYYSFNMGPAHFVAISTEVYYFPEYGYEPIINQYEWLKHDLEEASGSKSRSARPWIIVFGHRPMYCSSDTGEDCSFETNILKCCILDSSNYGLESLFHRNGVDLTFSGHMHYYERSFPIFNNEVYNGSFDEPYTNPGASVHVITGAAGMKSGTETASFVRKDFFPFFSKEYSFTVLTVSNKTHIHLEQISASRGGEVIDSIWLIKDPGCSGCSAN